MRIIETVVYKIDELSEEAQKKAYEKWLSSGREYFWSDDWIKSMEAFAKEFDIKIKDYSIGPYQSSYVRWEFSGDYNEVLELKGSRLLSYLWNRHRDTISTPKYISRKSVNVDKPGIRHRMIKWKEIKAGPNKGKWYSTCYSNLTKEKYGCSLTGYCGDNSLMYPIWQLWEKFDPDTTFDTLIDRCFDEFVKDFVSDVEHQDSFEYFVEHAAANEYEFEADGTIA